MSRLLALALGVGALLCTARSLAAEPETPALLALEGRLRHPDGRFFDGAARFTARLYSELEGGDPLYEETDPIVFGPGGSFATDLGDTVPLELPFDRSYWVGFSIDEGPELSPRLPVREVPMALRARVAGRLGGYAAAEFMLRDGSTGMSGPLSLGGHRIQDLAPPGAATDAATRAYVDRRILELAEYARGLAHGSTIKSSIPIRSMNDLEIAAAYVRNQTLVTLRGRIFGRRLPKDAKVPLGGVRVELLDTRTLAQGSTWVIAETKTSPEGHWSLKNVPVHTQGDLRLTMPGFRSHVVSNREWSARAITPGPLVTSWPYFSPGEVPGERFQQVSDYTLDALAHATVEFQLSDSFDKAPIHGATFTGLDSPAIGHAPPGNYIVRWLAGIAGERVQVSLGVEAEGYAPKPVQVSLTVGQDATHAVALSPAKAILVGKLVVPTYPAMDALWQIRLGVQGLPTSYTLANTAKDGSFSIRIPSSLPEKTRRVTLEASAPQFHPTTVTGIVAPLAGETASLSEPVVLNPYLVTVTGTVLDSWGRTPDNLDPSGIQDSVEVIQTGQVVPVIHGDFTIPEVPATHVSSSSRSLTLRVRVYGSSRRRWESANVTIYPRTDGSPGATYRVSGIRTF